MASIVSSGPTLFPRQRDLVELSKGQTFTLAYGSSRGGKTVCFVYLIIARCVRYPNSRHLILRDTASSFKTTVWPTLMEVLDQFSLRSTVSLNLTNQTIEFENGSMIVCGGVQDDEAVNRLMGAEYATIFVDEIVDISRKIYERVVTRLNGNWFDAKGTRCPLKFFATCNPTTKASWVYQRFVLKQQPGTLTPLKRPDDFAFIRFDANANPSVDAEYYERLSDQSAEATKRYVEGEWSDAVEGALFTGEDIEAYRRETPSKEECDLIVVSIDPATTANAESDETGIIVAGKIDGHCYILEDLSGRYRPEQWGMIAVDAYRRWGAGCIRIETNQGGDAMLFVIRSIDPTVTIKTFHAGVGQGKNMRAQPVAAEMAAGRIHLPYEPMTELEAQLVSMTGDYDRKRQKSPDRLDAFVYAIAELVLSNDGPSPVLIAKVAGFWRS